MHNGAKCHSPALQSKHYCYYHLRLHQLPKPAEPVIQKDSLNLPHIEDRTSILDAISRILQALSNGELDSKKAGSYLYALQIAAITVERKQDLIPYKAVESVTHSREGDELGPKLRICEPDDDCSICDQRETCPDSTPEQDSAES